MSEPRKDRDVPGTVSSTAAFWRELYRGDDRQWDKGGPAPPIARLLASGLVPRGRMAVPGCGFGHEAILAATLGFEAVGYDFVPEAVEEADRRARERGSVARFEAGDWFEIAVREAGLFDAILEHTFFCAIGPERRPAYVEAALGALKPGGHLLGLFYAHNRPGGPPYGIDDAGIRRLFEPAFEFLLFETPPDSFESRSGNERLFLFRKHAYPK